jgi:lysophospholipase L1-like esterase
MKKRCHPLFWQPQNSYSNNKIKKYDQVLKEFCQKENIFFVEIFERFNNVDYPKFLEDGIHPNSEGHKLIFESIKDFLLRAKII